MRTRKDRATFLVLGLGLLAAAISAVNSPLMAAVAILVSTCLCVGGLLIRGSHKYLSVCLSVLAAGVFWMASVDRYGTIEFCQRCPIHHLQWDYRFVGVSLYKKRMDVHDDLVARIGEALGRPCLHDYHGFPLARRWGLIWYRGYSSCMCCLTYEDKELREAQIFKSILDAAKNDPDLKDRFYERVIVSHDWKYLRSFAPEVRQHDLKGNSDDQEPEEIED